MQTAAVNGSSTKSNSSPLLYSHSMIAAWYPSSVHAYSTHSFPQRRKHVQLRRERRRVCLFFVDTLQAGAEGSEVC